MKLIAQGAEAKIFLAKNHIVKERFRKNYRTGSLDEKLRHQRTRKEAKVLHDLASLGFVPRLLKKDASVLEMEYLSGKRIRDVLTPATSQAICTEIGTKIRQLHDKGIIHGDLTTSNMILHNNQVYVIDFGLSFHSDKIEDKAVDLHVLKETLKSKHYALWERCFDTIIQAYSDPAVSKRLEDVELRGRYKQKGS